VPKVCKAPGCDRPVMKGCNLCATHEGRWRRYKSFDLPVREPAPVKVCSVPDCDRPVVAHGLCPRHYMVDYHDRNPRCARGAARDRRAHVQTRSEPKVCNVHGCEGLARARGMCLRHYSREWKRQHRRMQPRVVKPPRVVKLPRPATCHPDKLTYHTDGRCYTCYQRDYKRKVRAVARDAAGSTEHKG